MQLQEISYRDQTSNKVTLFASKKETKITIILLPALGVRASYYEVLAKHFAEEGMNIITVDWRGNGHSSVRPSRQIDFGYETILQDTKEVITFCENWFPNTKKYILGHSLGGQIGSLLIARYPNLVQGLIKIASCSVYYKGWDGVGAWQVYGVGKMFYQLSRLIGHFPGDKLGFGGREARTLMKDWGKNATSGKYILKDSNFDYEKAMGLSTTPVFTMALEGDTFAPPKACKNLDAKFHEAAPIKYLFVTKADSNIKKLNHFSWAKSPAFFYNKIKNWIV